MASHLSDGSLLRHVSATHRLYWFLPFTGAFLLYSFALIFLPGAQRAVVLTYVV